MNQQDARESAFAMRESLQSKKITVDKNGIKLVIRGDQYIEELTINNQPYYSLLEALNEAITQTKQLAVQELMKIGKK